MLAMLSLPMSSSEAKALQASLQDILEQLNEAKNEHDRLEGENKSLEDYIGSLTRSMAANKELTSTTGTGRAKVKVKAKGKK